MRNNAIQLPTVLLLAVLICKELGYKTQVCSLIGYCDKLEWQHKSKLTNSLERIQRMLLKS